MCDSNLKEYKKLVKLMPQIKLLDGKKISLQNQ